MTAHDHPERVAGCFRCDLATDETMRTQVEGLAAATGTTVEDVARAAELLLGSLPPAAVADPTPAVRRASEAHYAAKVVEAANNWPSWAEAPIAWRDRTVIEVRRVGADLLVVEEVAHVLAAHHLLGTRVELAQRSPVVHCKCGWAPDWAVGPWIPQFDAHQAQEIRTAMLGADS